MSRTRRRFLWTLRWYYDEFLRVIKKCCCCCIKTEEAEIPMSLISAPEIIDEPLDESSATPFLSSLPGLLHTFKPQNTSLTTCIQCGRVFPDFFHGIRVIYRQGPRYWTCAQCAAISRGSAPTTPIIVIPPRKL